MNRTVSTITFAASAILILAVTIGLVRAELVTSVTDGDTVRVGDERIRLRGIDTPEIRSPRCREERRRGLMAKRALQEMLASTEVQIERLGRDRYGRTLAVIRVRGTDVGSKLIQRGLALPWHPGARDRAMRVAVWCGRDGR